MTLAIQYGIIGLLIFTPLAFGAVEVWAKGVFEMGVFLLLGLWVYAFGFRSLEAPRIPGPLLWLFFFFSILFFAYYTGGTSLYPHGSRSAVLLGGAYAAVFWLVISSAREEAAVNRIVLTLVITGFGVALFSILQTYAWNGKLYWVRETELKRAAFGPFVNRNHLAGYLEMIIPLSIGYTVACFGGIPVKGTSAWRRLIHRMGSEHGNKLMLLAFMTLVMGIALALTLSRSGILSLLSAFILIGVILFAGQATRRWVLLPGGILAGILLGLTWFGLGPLIERFQTLFQIGEDESMQTRIQVWKDSARILSDYPLTGSGIGTFEAVYPGYKTLSDQLSFEHAHNDYLQLLVETGWLGFFLAMAAGGIILGFVLAGWARRRSHWARAILSGGFTGVAALMVHGFTDFNFHIPSNALTFTVILALLWNLSWKGLSRGRAFQVSGRRPLRAFAGLAVILFFLVQSGSIFAADRFYQKALHFEETGELETAEAFYEKAAEKEPDHFQYQLAIGKIYEKKHIKGDPEALSKAFDAVQAAIKAGPTIAEPRMHLGWIHAQRGDRAGASAAFEKVLELEPMNNNFRHYIGMWYAGIGEKEKALSLAGELRENRREVQAREIELRLEGVKLPLKG